MKPFLKECANESCGKPFIPNENKWGNELWESLKVDRGGQKFCSSKCRLAVSKPREFVNRCRKYHISPSEYFEILERQGGRCGVCRSKPETKTALEIDHCHKSGLVRGLLCGRCNTGIGQLADNIAGVLQAAKYLGRFWQRTNPRGLTTRP